MKGIQSLLRKKYIQKNRVLHIDDKTVFHVFSKVIKQEYGNQGVKNIIPEYYRNNIIFVSFKQSLWAQEIWVNKQIIIDKFNNEINNNILRDIKVKH